MVPKKATVRTSNRGCDVDYDIEGTPLAAQEEVDRLFQQFHPCGYNTRILSDIVQAGLRSVIVTRWTSCD